MNRMWVLQSQGQDCRKRSLAPKTRVQGSLKDFLSEKKVELKLKGGDEDTSLGPQHAELLVRLFKLCSEEATSSMILRLCNMKEKQRLVMGQAIKVCPDGMVANLVERLNNMEKEQMDLVLDTEGELAGIVQEVVTMKEQENIEEAGIDQGSEAPDVSMEEKVVKIKLESGDGNEWNMEELVDEICAEVVDQIVEKETMNGEKKYKEKDIIEEITFQIDTDAVVNKDNIEKILKVEQCSSKRGQKREKRMARITYHAPKKADLENEQDNIQENELDIIQEDKVEQQKSKLVEKGERLHASRSPCEVCGKVFNRPGLLKSHMITHSDVREFACNDCGSKFLRKHHLKIHFSRHHNKERDEGLNENGKQREKEEKDQNRVCELCGKNCPSARSLREHKNSHSPDYSCKECGKAFTTTRSLKNHINIVHEKIRKYLCNSCGKSFGRTTNLNDHRTRIHQINVDEKNSLRKEVKKREREDKDQNTVCELCGKNCPSTRTLRVHMNTHSPDFACKECGKTFTLTRYLKDHINVVHERVKKHLCNLCGKSFGRSTNLHDHQTRMHKTNTN